MQFRIHTIQLPTRRPFSWRALGILVVLYFLGNLSGNPLLWAAAAVGILVAFILSWRYLTRDA